MRKKKMSKMGGIHLQAQEDASDGMDLSRFLDEYGDGALEIWEEFNGSVEEDMREKSFFGKSLEKQSDYEVQTEHWDYDRKITDF